MNHPILTENAKTCLFFVVAMTVFTVLPAGALAKVSDLVTNVGNEAPIMTAGAIKLCAFAGFVFLIMGVVGFMTKHKTQIPAGVCFGLCIGGIVLLGIVQFATEGIDTIFDSTSDSGLEQIVGSK